MLPADEGDETVGGGTCNLQNLNRAPLLQRDNKANKRERCLNSARYRVGLTWRGRQSSRESLKAAPTGVRKRAVGCVLEDILLTLR